MKKNRNRIAVFWAVICMFFCCLLGNSIQVQAAATEYSITYELNGGKNATSNPAAYHAGDEITMEAASRKGYRFEGWYQESSFRTQIAKIGADDRGDKVFYAKWTPKTYHVLFDGNGAETGSMAAMRRLEYDASYSLTKNSFQKSGCRFVSWNTAADGSGKSFGDEAVIKNLSASSGAKITLYAQWETYGNKILYTNVDSTTDLAGNPLTYTKEMLPIALAVPSRHGYKFDGWFFKGQKVIEIPKGSSGDLVVEARWLPKKYHIAFDGNGADSGSMKAISVFFNEYAVLPSCTFVKEHYQFAGWNSKPDGTGTTYNNFSNRPKNLSATSGATVTLYAQWTDGPYTIEYENIPGRGLSKNPNPTTYRTTELFELQPAETRGYIFLGWFYDAALTDPFNPNLFTYGGDKTLYAKWKPKQYSIYFDGNGADSGEMNAMTKLKYGTKYYLRGNLFRKEGAIFDGWNTKADGSGVPFRDGEAVQNLSASNGGKVTLYAQWRTKIGY